MARSGTLCSVLLAERKVTAWDTCQLGETGTVDDLEKEVEMRKDSPGNQDK